jgi:hypothetical protein
MKYPKKLSIFYIPAIFLILVYGGMCSAGMGARVGSFCLQEHIINYYWAMSIIIIVGLFFSFPQSKIFIHSKNIAKYLSRNNSSNKLHRILKSLFNAFFWSSLIMLIFFSPSFLYIKNNFGISKFFEIVFLTSSIYSILYIFGLHSNIKKK